VGDRVQELGFDRLLILADPAEAEALATHAGRVPSEKFATYESLVERLEDLMQPGDRILFKASRSVGLDRAVKAFLNPD
jgi:UDP-N-acetylmuramoyl-tripeptide--D-alanyl-D-alanine ligase